MYSSMTNYDYHSKPYVIQRVHKNHVIEYIQRMIVIGERSEPPLIMLSGEFCIASRTLVCLSLYIYIWCTYGRQPIPCPLTLCTHTLNPDIAQRKPITIETESERERDNTKAYNR